MYWIFIVGPGFWITIQKSTSKCYAKSKFLHEAAINKYLEYLHVQILSEHTFQSSFFYNWSLADFRRQTQISGLNAYNLYFLMFG